MPELILNPHRTDSVQWDAGLIAAFSAIDIQPLHESLPGFAPTPLLRLRGLAKELGLGEIFIKDESQRLGLKAFKVLGASYAIYRFLKQRCEEKTGAAFTIEHFHKRKHREILGPLTFCTATDGNHGRAVAWAARLLGERAVIFMPASSVPARIEAIRGEGAEVIIVDGSYDLAVQRAQAEAVTNGWQVISDTSYGGYTEIPRWIMAGYTTMFREVDDSLGSSEIDCVIVQAGVGSLGAAVAWYYTQKPNRPRLISVEPTCADCLLRSATTSDGSIQSSRDEQESIMAGLNCGTPSLIAWPLMRDRFDAFISIEDEFAVKAVRKYFRPAANDPQLISGESGAAGLGALLAIARSPDLEKYRHELNLSPNSRLLLLNTEGDTDPVNFRRIVS
jgi:diaminopropionate ammonia-lyase